MVSHFLWLNKVQRVMTFTLFVNIEHAVLKGNVNGCEPWQRATYRSGTNNRVTITRSAHADTEEVVRKSHRDHSFTSQP